MEHPTTHKTIYKNLHIVLCGGGVVFCFVFLFFLCVYMKCRHVTN